MTSNDSIQIAAMSIAKTKTPDGKVRAFINSHREPVKASIDANGKLVTDPPADAQYVRELNATEIAALEAPTE